MFSRQCHMLVRNILTACGSKFGNGNGFEGGVAGTTCAGIRWTSAFQDSNYYEALGISRTSTQNDIKAAYYKLSMQYHPDKNKGSEQAAKKFREITQAYEVLGNYRLRRLYDKGIIHTAGSQYTRHPDVTDIEPEVEDDAETKFYKSRFKKSTVGDISGRTPIYDFDEWSRQHYGKSFHRRKEAKAKWDRSQAQKASNITTAQNEVIVFGMVFCVIVAYALFYAESSYDTPKERAIRLASEKRELEIEVAKRNL